MLVLFSKHIIEVVGRAADAIERLKGVCEAHEKEIVRLKTEWGIYHVPKYETFVCQVPAQSTSDSSDDVLLAWKEQCDDFPAQSGDECVAIVTAKYIKGDDQVGAHMELTFVRWEVALTESEDDHENG